jgi:predicted HTH domain antitoxin
MQLTLIDNIVLSANLSEADMRLALAIGLFQEDRITLAQAARLCGMDRLAFQHQLAARQIPIHYGEEELAADLRTIESLRGMLVVSNTSPLLSLAAIGKADLRIGE